MAETDVHGYGYGRGPFMSIRNFIRTVFESDGIRVVASAAKICFMAAHLYVGQFYKNASIKGIEYKWHIAQSTFD